MIVPQFVADDFGRAAKASSTFLRYEIRIGYEAAKAGGDLLARLVLRSESLKYYTQGEAGEHLAFPHSAAAFRSSVVKNERRSREGYISMRTASDGQEEVVVHQDGGSRGKGQPAPAASAPRTIVGTSNTSATPTILAARREMQGWRMLALEPSAMRNADRFHSEARVTANGGHLPSTLYRLAHQEGESADGVYAEVANRLANLVSVRKVGVVREEVRQLLTIEVEERSGVRLPANSLSDGTLRFLALAIMGADPDSGRLVCMEEPENGIHPAKMDAMVELLRDMAVDAEELPGDDNPVRQVIVASHSPSFVQLVGQEDLVFAGTMKMSGPEGRPVEVLRCWPLEGSWRAARSERTVGRATLLDYLTGPPGAQFTLPGLSDSHAA